VALEISDAARIAADGLDDIVADVLLGATLEAIRNASRHARGGNLHRPLGLRVEVDAHEHFVSVSIADDGVGLRSETGEAGEAGEGRVVGEGRAVSGSEDTGGSTRSGLLTHSALLSLVSGSLAVHSQPGHGMTVLLRVPRVSEAAGT
jgi:signal transduction histidine kinase